MKRLIAFALALAAVFGVSFALYRPELAQNAAQDSADDKWVGYFFSLEPFDGKRYAERADDRYDFGVPGVPMFVSITAFSPDDPYYEEASAFNYSIGMAASEEVERSGLHVFGDDNGDRYETGGSILLDAQCSTELYACDVFRTADGRYYAVCTGEGCCGDSFGLSRSETLSWTPNGKKQSRTVSVSASLEAHTAAESAAFVWMDGEKNVLSRAEYPADAIPEALSAPEGAELLVVTKKNADGTLDRALFTAEDMSAEVYVPSALSGLLRVVYVTLEWGESMA